MRKKLVGIILTVIGISMIGIGLSPMIEAASVTITSVPNGYFTVTRYSDLTVPISLGSTHSVTVKYITGPYSSSWFYVEGDGVANTTCPVIQRGGSGSISITATNNSSYTGKTVRWTVVGVESVWGRETASFNVCFKSAKYTLTTSVSPSGSGTVSPSYGTYDAGSSVRLTATPASGYKFDYWTGDASGTTNPITITMNSNKSITANFSKIPIQYYTLSVSVASGEGTVSGGGQYQSGTSAEIFATPAKDYKFDHWGGDASGTANPTTVVMSRNKTVYAYFEYVPPEPDPTYYTLYVSVSPPGAGTVTPSFGEYLAGTGATIRASPSTSYEFAYWTGDASGSANPVTITMNSNKSITAIFNEVIVNKPPTAFFSYSPTGPLVDQTVSFTDQSSDVDGTIVSRYWVFGSGASPSTSSARNPTCVYSTVGTKTVRLTVTDDDGDSGEITKTLTITELPSGDFYVKDEDDTEWCGPLSESATLVFNKKKLDFRFEATHSPTLIDAVEIEIVQWGTKITMSKVDANTWTKTITFEEGSYDVHGIVRSGTHEITVMSLTMGIPEEPMPPAPILDIILLVMGAAMVVGGAVLIRKD